MDVIDHRSKVTSRRFGRRSQVTAFAYAVTGPATCDLGQDLCPARPAGGHATCDLSPTKSLRISENVIVNPV
ncbi:MAG: hypothetical protein ABIA92_00980 [Patescibacteria group bacterium]